MSAEPFVSKLSASGNWADPRRRADVDAKQQRIAQILHEHNCDCLLLLDPANFRWLTAGAMLRGLQTPLERPALFFTPHQRWVICSSLDAQRLFDEELGGLGFQLKECPWNASREVYLTDVTLNRRFGCDVPFRDGKLLAGVLQRERRILSDYELDNYRALSAVVSQALENTGRSLQLDDSEDEIAGYLVHRLVRRGVEPLGLQVAVDGRARKYRRHGAGSRRLRDDCVMQVTGGRDGLFATASRTVCFGLPDPQLRREFDLAVQLSAVWLSAMKPGEPIGPMLDRARKLLNDSEVEHEWRLSPAGFYTGHSAIDAWISPQTSETFRIGEAIVWQTRIGAAVVCDTVVLTDQGPQVLTASDNWPTRRIRVNGVTFERPDLLMRTTASATPTS